MSDGCETTATFIKCTREESDIVINFLIQTSACEASSGRVSYDYTIVTENGTTQANDGNSLEWNAADGNNFFLRDRRLSHGIADIIDVVITDVLCTCL